MLNYFRDGVCSSTNEELLKDIKIPKVCVKSVILHLNLLLLFILPQLCIVINSLAADIQAKSIKL